MNIERKVKCAAAGEAPKVVCYLSLYRCCAFIYIKRFRLIDMTRFIQNYAYNLEYVKINKFVL